MKRMLMKLSLTLLWAACLVAGDKPWTLDAIMNLRTVSDPQITADGSKVAYVVHAVNAKRNAYDSGIWVVAATGGQAYQAAVPHYSDRQPRWSADGKMLAFLSSRDGVAQVYVIDAGSRTPRKVTSSPTEVESFAWSPDGRKLGYLALDPDRRKSDDPIVAGEGYRYTRLHIVPLAGGHDQMIEAGGRNVLSFNWAPDNSKIVYAAQPTPKGRDLFNADVYETDLTTRQDKPLVVQPGQDLSPAYSPDGRQVVFHSQRGKLNWFGERSVGIVPSGGGTVRYLTDKMDGDVWAGGTRFWWAPDASKIILGAGKGTNDYLYSVNPQNTDSTRLPYTLTDTSAFSVSKNGERVALIKASGSAPGDVYIEDLKSGRELRLSDLNPQVPQYHAVTSRTIRWKSPDGMDVEGVLRLPFGHHDGTRVPLLVSLHGGPTGVEVENFPIPRTYPTQLFLEAGFAVLEPNFRGSINYHAAFRLATAQQQGIGDLDDIMSGIDRLIADGTADPDRLGVMGWSYGGFFPPGSSATAIASKLLRSAPAVPIGSVGMQPPSAAAKGRRTCSGITLEASRGTIWKTTTGTRLAISSRTPRHHLLCCTAATISIAARKCTPH